ncbi:MAG: aldo/keto reductase [Methanobrevibacter sp.]|nr:aldo/keto reductase [Methanobrevibacter sp.]MBQ6345850.1 aldo/keto reductase [Methanobrevibacter sp.]MBQ6350292.1 aldo/keto reductase [Methanobrevibacter sp.]MBQ6630365.1 aldo/keto reductase [Methanobrevibacter sp.]
MEYKTLSNGVEIPQLGFGVFQIPPEETKDVVKKAIEVGYRHFDTAQAYFNEAEIGEAIKESGIAREELFITTKVWVSSYGYEETKKAFQESLDKLQTNYVDLYLLHQCMGDVYSTWRAVEDLYKEGKIKAIGVCNFTQGRFTDLSLHAEIPPMVNQIEINPFYQQEGTVEFHKEFDAVVEAWGPLAEGKDDIFNNPILSEIGSKYGKSVAQVILRWLIQRDIVVFPKSTKESRMIENSDVFNFELTDEDMEKIKELETGVPIVEVDNPEFIKFVITSIA